MPQVMPALCSRERRLLSSLALSVPVIWASFCGKFRQHPASSLVSHYMFGSLAQFQPLDPYFVILARSTGGVTPLH